MRTALVLFLMINSVTSQHSRLKKIFVVRGYDKACTEGLMKIRNAFNAGNIQWDQNLANDAEAWAKKLAINSHMRPSSTNIGENVYMSTYNKGQINDRLSCSYPLWAWYSVIKPEDNPKHTLVQLVGEKVKRFGIGVAVDIAQRRIFVVGRFDANIPGSTWSYHKEKRRWYVRSQSALHSNKGKLLAYPVLE